MKILAVFLQAWWRGHFGRRIRETHYHAHHLELLARLPNESRLGLRGDKTGHILCEGPLGSRNPSDGIFVTAGNHHSETTSRPPIGRVRGNVAYSLFTVFRVELFSEA